ncbi:MAG: ATP-binding protein [Hyphomonadaceae bacterium]|nr:ATP-binding protein [Hyphomonadaceae bacterium]
MILARRLQPDLEDRLMHQPAVVLLGPRQVGKTTLARATAAARGPKAVYLDLESEVDLRRLDDAEAFVNAHPDQLIVIDEIHRAPGLFPQLRGFVDRFRRQGRKAGHFLLLGSAALDLMRQASESLAGRVSYLELSGLDVLEAQSAAPQATHWARGGFPESLLASDDRASFRWRKDFIRSYLERDVPLFAPRLPAATIGRLWTMLAHAQGAPLNAARLAASLAVSAPAVARYIDLLVDLLLVRRLPPWTGNVGKRLVKSPKLYLRDSGIAHALLDLSTWDNVVGHPVAGASWEGFVIENLIAAAGDNRQAFFYRTADGAEMDLVFERGGQVELAIEIKLTSAPSISKGFYLACEALKPRAAFVVHGGDAGWPASGGVKVRPLADMMKHLADSA